MANKKQYVLSQDEVAEAISDWLKKHTTYSPALHTGKVKCSDNVISAEWEDRKPLE